MIVDCISDLHGHFPEMEGGDLLIIAGDIAEFSCNEQYIEFNNWVIKQPYRKVVIIGGNHDNWLQSNDIPRRYFSSGIYLKDSGTEFEGLKIWGSPWTQSFKRMNPHCKAFTMSTEKELAEKWNLIPEDVDILITHSPMWGVLDEICLPGEEADPSRARHVGSKTLRTRIDQIKPRLHVFGHVHEGYGIKTLKHDARDTLCVNASHVNSAYKPINPPSRIIFFSL